MADGKIRVEFPKTDIANPFLTQLGSKVDIPKSPEEAILEKIPVTSPGVKQAVVRFTVPEFTSLCPVTGQPDFARFIIDFIPNNYLVESKSLKLFMSSFRNTGIFHENATVAIGEKIRDCIKPNYIRVTGIWYARGGIPIDVVWSDGNAGSIAVPDIGLPSYTGR